MSIQKCQFCHSKWSRFAVASLARLAASFQFAIFYLFFFCLVFSLETGAADLSEFSGSSPQGRIAVFAMSELFVGKDPKNWSPSEPEWKTYELHLGKLKNMGFTGVTVDVWMGVDLGYYDHLFELVRKAGLKIAPILATHACGGNVGDNCQIPLPSSMIKQLPTYADGLDARFLSEGGNWSNESVGFWVDPLPLYLPFWRAFRDRYAETFARDFVELIVSLGPAGELTYPSYHVHDAHLRNGAGVEIAKFPNRGALQASSPLARRKFNSWLMNKYLDLEGLNRAWQSKYRDWSEIDFYTTTTKVEEFFAANRQFSLAGQDFFDWYYDSKVQFGLRVVGGFSRTFHVESRNYRHARIGHKVPGIHWDFDHFRAFLTAGQGRTRGASLDETLPERARFPSSWSKEEGYGLQSLVNDFLIPLRLQNRDSEFISTYTCGEQANCLRAGPGGAVMYGGAFDMAEAFGRLTMNAWYRKYRDLGSGYEWRRPQIAFETSLVGALWSEPDMNRLIDHVVRAPHATSVVMLRMGALAAEEPAPAVKAVQTLSNCTSLLEPRNF